MDYRWTNDGVSMEYLGRKTCADAMFPPSEKRVLKKKKSQVFALVCKNLTCKLLLMSVGSLFAIFCLLFGRTRTVSSGYVFLFLCLGLDLSVILLWLGASAGE